MFQKLMEDHQSQPMAEDHDTPVKSEALVAMTEQQLWLAALEGKNKGHVFDLSCKAHVSSQTYTSPSPLPPTPPQPNPAMEDHIGRLETMMVEMMSMMREIRASSSTAEPSQSHRLH
ncbi:UNVERIFIED_CONTAM: hypothetical protein Sradi_1889000 [Sesamum radiatum]|uniref:Uncharacterized protein n=1 Tax=Sesamum radiatum TaxID=300843 RepID=A0AAW2U156_SESRA